MPIPVIGLHRDYYEQKLAERKGIKRKGSSFPNGNTLSYKLFGISTVHLEHELILVVTSLFLTTASFMSLYRYSFPATRDVLYIIMTFLWLSRYVFHRIICTTDTNSTQHGPNDGWRFMNSLTARFQWIWISMTSGGQYYDVPISMLTRLHAKEEEILSNDFSNKGGEINYNTSGLHESRAVKVLLIHPLCFVTSITKWISQYVQTKQSKTDLDWIPPEKPSRRGSHTGASSANQDQKKSDSFRSIYSVQYRRIRYSVSMCWNYLPQPQAVLFFTALFLCSLQIYMHYSVWKMNSIYYKNSSFFGFSGFHWDVGDGPNLEHTATRSMPLKRNLFAKYHIRRSMIELLYSPLGVFCTIMTIGCLGSLLFFGRLILPLPDLVANPQEPGRHKSLTKKIGTPWCEKYRSIANADRLQLHFIVIALRVLEYVILCFALPRSEYICKATGHCDIDVSVFEMGPLAVNRGSGRRMYDSLIYDSFLSWVIGIITVLITSLVLLSSAVTLDRSHLAMKAYLCQEEASGSSKRSGSKRGGQFDFDFSEFLPPPPDIKKGTFATLRQTMDSFQAFVYSVFADEVGPLSTSRILSVCSSIHLGISIFVIILFLFYYTTDRYWHPLVVLYLSFFSSAFEINAVDPFSLHNLADDISKSHNMAVKRMNDEKENKRE